MREIKFRALAGGVMVHFGLFDTHPINGFDGAKHIQRNDPPNLSVSDKCHVMQYTGLRDKNGVEIYEGDIIRHDKGSRGFSEPTAVVWEGTSYITKPQILTTFHAELVLKLLHLGVEVIGNIYENPELLKVK